MLDNYDKRLKPQVLNELTNRAKSGIFSYLILWLAIAIWADLHILFPLFFWVNTIIFSLGCLAKLTHHIVFTKKLSKNTDLLSKSIIINTIFSGLHWGVINAWAVIDLDLSQIHYIMLMTSVGFSMAGTANFAISEEIRKYYPFCIIMPGFIVGIISWDGEHLFIAFLAVLSLLYITSTAKIIAQDYWDAVHANLLMNDRALLLEELTNTDPLTQLKNRFYFDKEFLTEWSRCSKQSSPVSLMMIDLDHFKNINDTFGHQFGDTCLVEFSTLLSNLARDFDIVARYGGEEFIIFLPATSLEQSKKLAKNILNETSKLALKYEGEVVKIGCSIGIQSLIPNIEMNKVDLIKQADSALYMAKTQGRQRYYAYDKTCD